MDYVTVPQKVPYIAATNAINSKVNKRPSP